MNPTGIGDAVPSPLRRSARLARGRSIEGPASSRAAAEGSAEGHAEIRNSQQRIGEGRGPRLRLLRESAQASVTASSEVDECTSPTRRSNSVVLTSPRAPNDRRKSLRSNPDLRDPIEASAQHHSSTSRATVVTRRSSRTRAESGPPFSPAVPASISPASKMTRKSRPTVSQSGLISASQKSSELPNSSRSSSKPRTRPRNGSQCSSELPTSSSAIASLETGPTSKSQSSRRSERPNSSVVSLSPTDASRSRPELQNLSSRSRHSSQSRPEPQNSCAISSSPTGASQSKPELKTFSEGGTIPTPCQVGLAGSDLMDRRTDAETVLAEFRLELRKLDEALEKIRTQSPLPELPPLDWSFIPIMYARMGRPISPNAAALYATYSAGSDQKVEGHLCSTDGPSNPNDTAAAAAVPTSNSLLSSHPRNLRPRSVGPSSSAASTSPTDASRSKPELVNASAANTKPTPCQAAPTGSNLMDGRPDTQQTGLLSEISRRLRMHAEILEGYCPRDSGRKWPTLDPSCVKAQLGAQPSTSTDLPSFVSSACRVGKTELPLPKEPKHVTGDTVVGPREISDFPPPPRSLCYWDVGRSSSAATTSPTDVSQSRPELQNSSEAATTPASCQATSTESNIADRRTDAHIDLAGFRLELRKLDEALGKIRTRSPLPELPPLDWSFIPVMYAKMGRAISPCAAALYATYSAGSEKKLEGHLCSADNLSSPNDTADAAAVHTSDCLLEIKTSSAPSTDTSQPKLELQNSSSPSRPSDASQSRPELQNAPAASTSSTDTSRSRLEFQKPSAQSGESKSRPEPQNPSSASTDASQSRPELESSSAANTRPTPSQSGHARSNLRDRRTNAQLASLTTEQRVALLMEASGVNSYRSPPSQPPLDNSCMPYLNALLDTQPSTSTAPPATAASALSDQKVVLVPLKESGSLCSPDLSSADGTDNSAAAAAVDTTDSSISSSLFVWSVGSNESAGDSIQGSSIEHDSSSSSVVLTDLEDDLMDQLPGEEGEEEEDFEEEDDLLGDEDDDDLTTDTSHSFSMLDEADGEPGDEKYKGDGSDSWTDDTDHSEYKEEELMENNSGDKPKDGAEDSSWSDVIDSFSTEEESLERSGRHGQNASNCNTESMWTTLNCAADDQKMKDRRCKKREINKPKSHVLTDVETNGARADRSRDELKVYKWKVEELNINNSTLAVTEVKLSPAILANQVETSDGVLSSTLSDIDVCLGNRLKDMALDKDEVLEVL